jgi:SAM-dependent methyltransferase
LAGWDEGGDDYERGRPDYSPALLTRLRRVVPRGATVVDVGAGTGKLSKVLAHCDCEVVALEPLRGMAERVRHHDGRIAALRGWAEAIPLRTACADIVVASQSIHWFQNDTAIRELLRIARPDAPLVLTWNLRLDPNPLMDVLGPDGKPEALVASLREQFAILRRRFEDPAWSYDEFVVDLDETTLGCLLRSHGKPTSAMSGIGNEGGYVRIPYTSAMAVLSPHSSERNRSRHT